MPGGERRPDAQSSIPDNKEAERLPHPFCMPIARVIDDYRFNH